MRRRPGGWWSGGRRDLPQPSGHGARDVAVIAVVVVVASAGLARRGAARRGAAAGSKPGPGRRDGPAIRPSSHPCPAVPARGDDGRRSGRLRGWETRGQGGAGGDAGEDIKAA